MKSIICLFVKNEDENIREWICHHHLVGFDKIVIFDNMSDDNTKKSVESLMDTIPIDYHFWDDKQENLENLNKQGACYSYAIEVYKEKTEWMCFLDADEFLIPPENEKVHNLLETFRERKSFCINWQTFGSSHLKESSSRLVLEAFTRRGDDFSDVNRHVKMFFRPKFSRRVLNPHYIDVGDDTYNIFNQKIVWSILGVTKPDGIIHAGWRIHHYIIRSKKHWEKRLLRKQPNGIAREWDQFKNYDKNEIIDLYAYPSAQRVWKLLSEYNYTYQVVPKEFMYYDEQYLVQKEIVIVQISNSSEIYVNFHEGFLLKNFYIYINNLCMGFVSKHNKETKFSMPDEMTNGSNLLYIKYDNRIICNFVFKGELKSILDINLKTFRDILGSIDPINNNIVNGWFALRDNEKEDNFKSNNKLLIMVNEADNFIIDSNLERKDVSNKVGIPPNCGFSWEVPEKFIGIKNLKIEFFSYEKNIPVPGSPIIFNSK